MQSSPCSCIDNLLQALIGEPVPIACDSSEHDCTCQAIMIGDRVFDYFIGNCQSDVHACICNYIVMNDTTGEESDPADPYSQGSEMCKSITGHVCTCSSLNGPASCRGYRHYCVCIVIGPEFCEASELHDCCCNTCGDPSSCKSDAMSHRCICINDHTQCRVRYGYHICICGNSACRSRIHSHSEDLTGSDSYSNS